MHTLRTYDGDNGELAQEYVDSSKLYLSRLPCRDGNST